MAGAIQHLDETGEVAIPGNVLTWPVVYPGNPVDRAGTAVGGTVNYIDLDGGASVLDGAYRGYRVGITLNTGVQQVRTISQYVGATQRATVETPFSIAPDSTSEFLVTLARRFAVQNVGDAALNGEVLNLGRDGANGGIQYVRLAPDTAAIIPPYGVSISLGSAGDGGVWSATGFAYYRITATTATGETNGSREVTVLVDNVTKRVTLAWTPPAGATAIKVYRSLVSTVYTTPALLTSLAGASTGFVDDGSAVSSGALPLVNTSGGDLPFYGTPPALGFPPLTPGTLQPGQQFLYWVGWTVAPNLGSGVASAILVPTTT